MALENVLVYRMLTGDNTYPHSGDFTIGVAGKITIDDSNGVGDSIFGDNTDGDSADVPDQDATASTVAEISVGDTVDSRYFYTVTGSDGSSGKVYFLATNGANNYGSLMASDFPLTPGVTYTFVAFDRHGSTPYSNLVPCFGKGTMIETDKGELRIEQLSIGDRVRTLDNGYQPVCWIGMKSLDMIDLAIQPKLFPIRIEKGALGENTPNCELLISPQHRVLVRSRIAQRMFGTDEVLIPANKLLELDGVSVARDVDEVTYFHLLFEDHQIIYSGGAVTESLYTGPEVLKGIGKEARAEIGKLFPEIVSKGYEPTLARPVPEKGKRMRRLVSRHAENRSPLQ